MNRRLIAAFALVASLLVTAHVPVVIAGNYTAVGSEHTTDTDFNNATTLTRVHVDGSGDSADVALNSSEVVDDFEDGDISEWSVSSSPAQISTTRVHSGTYSMEWTGSASSSTTERSMPDEAHDTVSLWLNKQSFAEPRPQVRISHSSGGNAIRILIDDGTVAADAGSVLYYDGSWVDTGIQVTEDTWYRFSFTNIDYSNNQYDIEVSTDSGDVGSTSNVNMVNGVSSLDTIDLRAEDQFWIDDITTASGSASTNGTYVSATHSVDNATTGWANLTLSNANATVTWLADTDGDGTFETTADTSTYTSTQNATADLSGTAATDWRVNVTFQATGVGAVGELHDEGVLFTASSPTVDNGSASPSGGTKLSSATTSLSIPVNDSDFATAQGDNVTVEYYVDGSKVGTEVATSNQTVTHSTDVTTGGTHTWHAKLNDSYDPSNTVTSDTFDFQVPGKLTLYNESNTSEIINDSGITTEVTFFTSDQVYTRSANDGSVNLSGLPADETLVVDIQATNYTNRRVIIDSLYEQQAVYLLPTSASQSEIVFELDDRTGEFPATDTHLVVEKPLNVSGTTKYVAVAGDEFGATGDMVTALENDVRYRLRVVNGDGDERLLGPYTPTGAANEVLPIGRVVVNGNATEGYIFDAQFHEISGSPYIRIAFRDDEELTTNFSYEIYDSNGTIVKANTTETGDFGSYTETIALPSNATDGKSYTVEYRVFRDGTEYNGKRYVGSLPNIADQWDIDPTLLSLFGYIAIMATGGLVVIANPRIAALGMVFVAAIVNGIGVVDIHPVLLGVGGVVAVIYNVGGGRL